MAHVGEFGGSLSRRTFGTLTMGAAAYLLLNGCVTRTADLGMPSDGRPVRASPPQDGLPRGAPGDFGVSADAVLAFLDDVSAAGLEMHSFMLMRRGHVVAEGFWWPYAPDRIHITHSLTKSVTSVAVGLALAEGRFGLDDKVASFFPQYVPADASDNLKAMTVRNLLTMETGHDHETSGSLWRPIQTSWVAEFFKIPVAQAPGTHFQYTSAATYMLSAIVSRTTGTSMADYLRPRFFAPLGIDHWQWDTSPGGITPGANGLSWTTDSSLKLGALHANHGLWNGTRILPEQWVRDATTRRSAGENDEGYGYQWWMGPGSAYYALGLFTQLAIVFPEHDAVLAIFSAIDGSKKLKPLVWKHFPAAFGNGMGNLEALRERTAGLRVLPELSPTSSPRAAGLRGQQLTLAANDQSAEWVSFEIRDKAVFYRLKDANGEHVIAAGLGNYLEQETSMTGARLHHEYRPNRQRVIAGARWRSPDVLEMTWQFVETSFRDTVVCTFSKSGVAIDRSVNINSAERKLPTLRSLV